jgi:hypothetical protein
LACGLTIDRLRQFPYSLGDFRTVDGTADLTAIRPYQARYVMLGSPVSAGCCTSPMGAVVLWSSTTCTSAYLTELWPTFTNFRRLLVVTWTIVIFRFPAAAFSVFARLFPYSRRDSRFDGHTTISSQLCHVGTPGVGRMLHKTKGGRCTSVQYLLYFGRLN